MGKIVDKKDIPVADLIPYAKNAKRHSTEQVKQIADSITEFGFLSPCLIDQDYNIIAGHGRVMAAKELNLDTVPCVFVEGLTEEQRRAYIIADNRLTELGEWDMDIVGEELKELDEFGFDTDLTGFSLSDIFPEQEQEVEEDEVPAPPEEPKSKLGDIYQLGKHRLMCGDSTKAEDVEKLMDGEKADLLFTDPPYGMKKEKEGVLNDNLNYDDLLDFNKKWIPLSFQSLKDNGSWYCWGIDEPLMDIYSNILKPMIKENKITFRNLLTWDKGDAGAGGVSFMGKDGLRSYPVGSEKCLFVMCGVQGFNNNADNYFEAWEPVRRYLYDERVKCGWDIPTMKTIAGHSDKSRDHWTSKSQFNLPTKEVYEKFQKWAKDHNVEAFKKEYEEIKKEYEEIKKEYYFTRAYFDNTHDTMTDVWAIGRIPHNEKEQAGGHATPKPIALCSRAIKSSSRENELVLDVFGGSGSTLIACEQLNRRCNMMELDPHYCDVIIERWENFTGEKAEKIN